MAIGYKFSGKRNARKVVKTIEVTEDSYQCIKGMIDSSMNFTDAFAGPTISDTYNIFGGNCYKALVTMALEQMIATFVHELEDKKMLSIGGEEAYRKILSIILPLMCYTSDGDEYAETLHFFNPDADEICMVMKECLTKSVYDAFCLHLQNMMRESENTAGEAALLAIMYMVSDSEVNDEEIVS